MRNPDILDIQDLSVSFPASHGRVHILDKVSFSISENEIIGLVGESGSGKTVTALSIMRLLDPSARIESGHLLFQGEDLCALSEKEMEKIRGSRIGMIFQSPRAGLNPLKKVGAQVAKACRLHRKLGRVESYQHALALLKRVGFPTEAQRAESYPHQLSTGMCQRVMIAMMIVSQPVLLIADEPTTALDPTIAAQIYDLLHEIQLQTRMAILLITHDLGDVAENCNRVAVMHAGHIVEQGNVQTFFQDHQHPYTSYLMRYLPRVDREIDLPSSGARVVEGIDYISPGCRYARKCAVAEDICFETSPELIAIKPDHWVRCHLIAPSLRKGSNLVEEICQEGPEC